MHTSKLTTWTAAAALILSATLASAQEVGTRATPDAGKSAEAEKAMAGFKHPEGTTVKLFAAEPLLQGPVAFDVDFDGRLYIAETDRFDKGVGDNRAHGYWLLDDLAAETIEDRQAYYDKWIKLGKKKPEWFTHNYDQVRRITDTDGDGKADESHVLSRFNDPLDGVGSGILAHYGDLYYTNIPTLWKLRDADNDGKAEIRENMSTGYGVRSALLGHDLHGLVWGPDGKLYFSVGDRGFNITTREGKTLRHAMDIGRGAVFRCNPDGSDLEVFAWGLRNPQELAFDDYGNLWTGDNNSDAGDAARLVYVVEQGDSGWAMSFQTLEGSNSRGPWNQEKLWHLRHEGQPAWHIPPVGHITSGPSGFVAYPGLGLPDKYNGYFFLCDFRAGTGNSGVMAFTVEPDGAGFQMKDPHQFWWHIVATDFDFGYDGKMYATDWVSGWSPRGQGRVYTLQDDSAIKDPRVAETMKIAREGFDKRSDDELIKLLGNADRRIRLQAQFELTKRGKLAELLKLASDTKASEITRIHAIWGAARVATDKADDRAQTLGDLLNDNAPEVRAQTLRAIGWLDAFPAGALIRATEDTNPRVRYFAAMAVGRHAKSEAIEPLIGILRENADKDVYLRHAAVTSLWRLGNADAVLKFADDESASVRLGVLLTLRRMQDARITRFLDDADEQLVIEAARAIYDLQIPGATGALADKLASYLGDDAGPADDNGKSKVTETSFTATFSDKPNEPVKLASLTFTDRADNYTTTIVGSFVAPASGKYVFRVAADDYAELMISTDDKPANLRPVAKVPSWTGRYDFTQSPEQTSKPLELKAGQRYAIRVEHREGGGNDYVTVVYTGPDGVERILGGSAVPAAPSAADAQSTFALHRRIISAAFRRGTPADAERLAAYAANGSNPMLMRQEALHELSDFAEPYPRERVLGFYRPLPKRDPAIVSAAVRPKLQALLDGELRAETTALAVKYRIQLDRKAMLAQVVDESAPVPARIASLRALGEIDHKQQVATLEEPIDAAFASSAPELRAEAIDYAAAYFSAKARVFIQKTFAEGTLLEKQRAIKHLQKIDPAKLEALTAQLDDGSLDPALRLDVYYAALEHKVTTDSPQIGAISSKLLTGDLATFESLTQQGGDPVAGRATFLAHAAAQCQRCHTVAGVGGDAGPNLSEIGKQRDRAYLVRALVQPQAEVAEGYGTISVTTKDGTTVAGVVRSEANGKLTLLQPDGKPVTVNVADITARTDPISAMPPMGFILKPHELRDVVAYLATLTDAKNPAESHGE